jgi:Protein of unknown function with PCYCGC motif
VSAIETGPVPDHDDRRPHHRPTWIIATGLVVLLIVGVGVGVVNRGTSAADRASSTSTGVTVALSALPSEMAAMYQYAAAHREAFAEIPCYCGCDRSLGHRNLEDCFVNADGSWDAHAAGCGVCTVESTMAKALLDEGTDVAVVRQKIIDRYGPPAAETGATT